MSEVIDGSTVSAPSEVSEVSTESVANEGSISVSEIPLESWDDEGTASSKASEVDSIAFDQDENQVLEAKGEVKEESDEEAEEKVEAKEEESEEKKNEEEANKSEFELPKELAEKGLLVKDNVVGKMIKVDGQETFVSLDELGSDYSGQKAISKRFTELDKKEKGLKQEIQTIEKYIDTFASKLQSKDVVGAFEYFGQFSGVAPHDVREALINALTPEIVRRSQMSEIEIKAEQLEAQNEFLKKQTESVRERELREQAQRELEQKSIQLREAHQVSQDEYDKAFNELNEDANLKGNVTPEDVISYITDVKAYNRAEQVLSSVDSSLVQNDKVVDTLHQIIKNNKDFTDDDLRQLVTQSFAKKEENENVQNIAKRVEKHSLVKENKAKVEAKPSKVEVIPTSYDMTWDDL